MAAQCDRLLHLARLDKEKLAPVKVAEIAALLRRLNMELTGLPYRRSPEAEVFEKLAAREPTRIW